MNSKTEGFDVNRRRFLKYAGTTAAIVGASALGLDYLLKVPSGHPNSTASTTGSLTSTIMQTSITQSSSTSAKLTDLHLRLFFNKHGNGIRNPDEDWIRNLTLNVEGVGNDYSRSIEPESDGTYIVRDVQVEKTYRLLGAGGFRYVAISNSEFLKIKDFSMQVLNEDPRVDLGLMEGFETFPFRFNVPVISFVDVGDVENRSAPARDWKGGTQTYKGHQGTDYNAHEATPVQAAAPGIVIGAEDDWEKNPDIHNIGNRIVIDHLNGYKTAYNHLKEITVRYQKFNLHWTDKSAFQKVTRGQVIATVGHTGTEAQSSHLHFEAWPPTYRYFGTGHGWVIDHYRDLFYGKHGRALFSNPVSLWTKDNDPQYASS